MKLTMNPTMKIPAAAIFLFAIAGCNRPADIADVPGDSDASITIDDTIAVDQPPPIFDAHAHPSRGPHGGDLIELGGEAYHGELVHGDEGVSIFILDGSAEHPVGITADKLTVSMKHDGEVRSFDLSADPDADDDSGTSSRYTSTDDQLNAWIEAGAQGVVVIQIEGKSFTGKIAHDHADHAH